MVSDVARRAQMVRDLKGRIADLSAEDNKEIIFIDASPQKERVTIWSMQTGEPLSFPKYMVPGLLETRLRDGRFAFTGNQEEAPEYKLGEIKCFLHPESAERPILDKIGLAGASCPAAHLANDYEKWQHAQHKHKKQWAAYQAYIGKQETEAYRQQQSAQLEATLEIARGVSGQRPPAPSPPVDRDVSNYACAACGWMPKPDCKNIPAAQRFHKRHCKGSVMPASTSSVRP